MCYLQCRQATGSTAQRTNLPTLRRTSKMHSRRKGRFWASGSLLRPLKCIWQGLERGTSCKTTEDRRALQDVHVDPALPICKDCQSKTWWHSQQKSLVFVKEYHRAMFCPPHCSWSTSMISSPLYQRGSQTLYMQMTWQSGMRLSTPPLQPTGSKKPSVISASGHWWTGASR